MEYSSSYKSNLPILYLVATPIGNLQDFSLRAINTLKQVNLIACEDTRVTAKLLNHYEIDKPLLACHEHNEQEASIKIVEILNNGQSVAYLSDAGYPLISDPGHRLVQNVINAGFPVSTIGGSSALLNALAASGLASDHFYFYGFLPVKASERTQVLKSLEQFADTLIFYEAPHRISETLKALAEVFKDRRFVIARELTKIHEEIIRGNLLEVNTINSENLRGEIVIIVEGAPQNISENNDIYLLNEIDKLLKIGLSLKQSCEVLSVQLSKKKNYLYQLYIKEKQ